MKIYSMSFWREISLRGLFLVSLSAVLIASGFFVFNANAAVTNLQLTSPNEGGLWGGGVKDITWTVTSAEPTDLIKIRLITINPDGSDNSSTLIDTDIPATDSSYTWTNLPNILDADNYRVRILDVATGDEYDTSDTNFIVDNTAPDTPLITDPAGSVVVINVDNKNTHQITGTAEAGSTVRIYVDGVSTNVTKVADGGGNFTFTNVDLQTAGIVSDTDYSISKVVTLTAKDTADPGNESINSASISYTQDTTLPAIASYTLNGGTADIFFNPGLVDIGIVATEPVEWISAKIEKVDDIGIYKNKLPGGDGTDTTIFDWNGLLTSPIVDDLAPDGEYKILVHIQDLAGNDVDNLELTPSRITVDTTNPSIDSFTAPVANQVYKNSVPLTFTVSDTNSITCSYQVNSDTPVEFTPCNNGFETDTTISAGLSDGRNDITFIVTDPAGNEATQSPISVVFDTDNILTVDDTPENSPDFATIQEAINKATAGDTIAVSSGTYTEDLIIDKQLIIAGADKTTTIIKGIANVPVISWPLAVPNIDIQADGVKLHDFTIQGPDYEAGKYVSGIVLDGQNIEIYNNDFITTAAEIADEIAHAITTYSKTAIPTADVSGLNIHNNTFVGSGIVGMEAIYINPHTGFGTITIDNNQISGSANIGITVESGNAVVSNNTISTNLDSESPPYGTYGIRFFDSTYAATYDNIVISNNDVQNFKRGIRIGNGGAGTSVITASILSNTLTNNNIGIWARQYGANITATSNSLAGNTIGIQNDDVSTAVNAANNWWGTAYRPTIEGLINENPGEIIFEPYYVDAAMTILSNTPVAIVFIDDDYIDGPIPGYIYGYSAFSKIQEGIDKVSSGGTINVATGTYGENPVIDKQLTLLGARANIDPAGSTDRVGESIITGQVEFTSTGLNSEFNGFKLDGNRIWIHGASGIIISNNILTNSSQHGIYIDGSSPNTQVLYNTISNPEWQGISNQGNSGVIISYNHVTGVTDQQPIESTNHTGTGIEITYNVISGNTGAKGINYWGGPGANISYNEINGTTGAWEGIFSDTKTNIIVGNIISNTGGPGIQLYPIGVASTAEKSIISGNVISLTKYQGIVVLGQAYTEVSDNTLSGCNYYGADGTGDWDYAAIHIEDLEGEFSDHTSITGNTVSDGINGIQTWSSNVTITGNEISGMGNTYADEKVVGDRTYKNSAILVGSNFGSGDFDPTGVVIENNKIHDNYWGLFYSTDLTNGVVAERNWWGDATGPLNTVLNPAGLGDDASNNVDFSPFCLDENCTLFGSIDPINSIEILFDPTSAVVNTNADLTITAFDAGNYIVVNDNSTQFNLTADNGASFGATLLTLASDGTTGTTITNDKTGIVNVTAVLVNSSITAAEQIGFTASDVTNPTVVSHTPVNNSTGVSITVKPTITFSESLAAGTVSSANIQLRKYSDNSVVPAIVSLVEGGAIVVITPNENLDNNTKYYFAVSAVVTDLTGNPLSTVLDVATKDSHEFTTVGIEPFVVDDIVAQSSTATPNNTYIDGWHYTYYLTINATDENDLFVRFYHDDPSANGWLNTTDGVSIIPANGNMRVLFNSLTGGGLGAIVGGLTEDNIVNGFGSVDSYEIGNLFTDQKLDGIQSGIETGILDTGSASGRQIQFDVFTKIPIDTVAGAYEADYQLQLGN